MTKKQISTGIIAFMILMSIYLVFRVNSNTMSIASYDAGINQQTGVGKLESFWTKYVGASKNSLTTYEDREKAEADSTYSIIALFVIDIAGVVAVYVLNKKPKPVSVPTDEEDDWRNQRRGGRRRRR